VQKLYEMVDEAEAHKAEAKTALDKALKYTKTDI
jgi:hypothetical protein